MPPVLPGMDLEVAKKFMSIAKKQGLFPAVYGGQGRQGGQDQCQYHSRPADGGGEETITADIALVSVGRHPATDGLGLDDFIGITMTPRGRIAVDKRFETSVEDIFAIGDVIEGPMLAIKPKKMRSRQWK